jgi:hypothetical protein
VARNKLVAAGASRLQKAADSKVDPAVPAELQVAASGEPSPFAGGRVLSGEDIQGSPEEQLAYVTERLIEIDNLGKRAEDFTILNKGVLLEVAQQRELHTVAGHTNFAVWAGGVLDVEPKYVFELLADAERIRAIGALGPDLAQHLTKANTRKVVSEVIATHGLEAARAVMTEGLAEAARLGKKRPTAAILSDKAKALTTPAIPTQETRSEISDPSPATEPPIPPALLALERAAHSVRERVYAPLAPAAVRAAADADAAAAQEHLEHLSAEIERAGKRLSAALRVVNEANSKQPEATGA